MASFQTLHVQKQAHDDTIWAVAWSRGEGIDGNRIVSGSLDDTVRAWIWRDDDDEQDENVKKENNSPLELKYIFDGHSLGAVSVDISCDGRTAATSSLDCQIRFLDLENGCPVQGVTTKIDAGPLESWTIAYSPDSTLIATGNHAGKIGIYDTQSGKLQTRLDTAGKFVLSVIFSPDGRRIASGSNDGMVKIFDVETEKLLHTLEGHALPVRSVAFVSDSDTVVTGSDDCHIKMYDIRREESPEMPISTFSGHGAWVLCVDPSPDGRYLASSSADKTVKVWNLEKQECVKTFKEHTDQVWSCKFNGDGTRLVSGGEDGTLVIYGYD